MTDGQFEISKIKVQNAKFMKPPAAGVILSWIPAFAGMTKMRGNDRSYPALS